MPRLRRRSAKYRPRRGVEDARKLREAPHVALQQFGAILN
jgi:hypothetical protein